jgi:diaminopimelate decarboxylase
LRKALQQVVDRFGTPTYVYFLDPVLQKVEVLRTAFEGRFEISYAVKSNPHPALLRKLREHIGLLDLSSGGELELALAIGWPAETLGFTGPAKDLDELRASAQAQIGAHVVESVEEAQELDALRQELSLTGTQPILLRVAPRRIPRGFGSHMAGRPTPFGVDEEEVDEAVRALQALSNLTLVGLHIYSGTQCLKAPSIVENFSVQLELFRTICENHDLTPERLVFGSGLGIPYHEGDQPLDLPAIGAEVVPKLDALRAMDRFADTELVLETGRYLVGEAGFYLTRIRRLKQSRGRTIGICDGGMHHHLAACGHLGGVIHRNYRMFNLSREPKADEETAPANLAGPLCTMIDTLGHGVSLPGLQVGDVIAIESSGAYGLSASPIHFIRHDRPREVLVETSGNDQRLIDISEESPATRVPPVGEL